MLPENKQNFRYQDVVLHFSEELAFTIYAEHSSLSTVRIFWRHHFPKNAILYGDAFERGYGDLKWKRIEQTTKSYWYFILYNGKDEFCLGVKTRPNALCFWTVEQQQLLLTANIRSGGDGIGLNRRQLNLRSWPSILIKQIPFHRPKNSAPNYAVLRCFQPLLFMEEITGTVTIEIFLMRKSSK